MDLSEAWTTYGRELPAILAGAKARPREERVAYLEGLLEEARKVRKALLAVHHPDRGGDPAVFKRVEEAYQAIERGTEEFKRAIEEASQDRGSTKSVRIVIDPVK